MRSFSYPKPLFQGLSESLRNVKFGKSDVNMGWTLLRLAGWLATIGIVGALLWQVTADVPFWSQAIAGLLLVVVGLLAGLHLGAHSATIYMTDVQRLNKVLAEQNKNLEAANAMLLRELSNETDRTSRSQSA